MDAINLYGQCELPFIRRLDSMQYKTLHRRPPWPRSGRLVSESSAREIDGQRCDRELSVTTTAVRS